MINFSDCCEATAWANHVNTLMSNGTAEADAIAESDTFIEDSFRPRYIDSTVDTGGELVIEYLNGTTETYQEVMSMVLSTDHILTWTYVNGATATNGDVLQATLTK